MVEMISLTTVYNELKRIEKKMVTREHLNSLIDSIEILSNPETMQQIASSLKDVQAGRVRKVGSVKDLLAEI